MRRSWSFGIRGRGEMIALKSELPEELQEFLRKVEEE